MQFWCCCCSANQLGLSAKCKLLWDLHAAALTSESVHDPVVHWVCHNDIDKQGPAYTCRAWP